MKRDALLIYLDGRERHIALPESLSQVPEPAPSRILLSEDGMVLAYLFRGKTFGFPVNSTDSVMVRDLETPEECHVYRESSDHSEFET